MAAGRSRGAAPLVVSLLLVVSALAGAWSAPAEAAGQDTSITTVNQGVATSGFVSRAPWGAAFDGDESAQDADFNADGDKADFVLHVWNAATGVTTNVGLPFSSFAIGDQWGILFGVFEAGQGPGGTDFNGDGDATDSVVHLRDSATGTVTNLGLAVFDVAGAAPWGAVFGVSEKRQGAGGTDLNADGDKTDTVLHIWSAATGTVTNLGLAQGALTRADTWGAAIGVSEAGQGVGGTDLNGDGDKSDVVLHVWDVSTGAVANLSVAALPFTEVASSWGFAFAVREVDQGSGGSDLNADGDKADMVVHVWNASTGAVTNLGRAVSFARPGAAPWGASFAVIEGDQGPGGTDLNGDGDKTDPVLHRWDAATGAVTNTMLATSGGNGSAAGWGLAFPVSEPDQGAAGSDLNGDGDKTDAVVHVWNEATGATSSLSLAAVTAPSSAEWGASFPVGEAAQGAGGTDFNGDGDKTDGVAHVWTPVGGTTNLSFAVQQIPAGRWGAFPVVSEADEGAGGSDFNADGDKTDFVVFATRVNRAPAAAADAYATSAGKTLVVNGVLGNDSDLNGDALTAELATAPANGTLTLNTNGSFTYRPDAGFVGADSFTYVANDGEFDSDPATVSLTVGAVPWHDVGLVDPSTGKWYLRTAESGAVTTITYGNPGDFPFMGDWDCDGTETPGLYRQSDGFVYLRNSNTTGIADVEFFFGNPGDVPIAGDFNNDGCDTVSIYRPSEQRFYIINKLGSKATGLGAAETDYLFGNPGDKAFVGDFDGDGIETVGLHRESTGLVYFRNSHTTGIADAQFIFGDPGDRLIAGDWNGNAVMSPALFRPSDARVFQRFTNTQGIADDEFSFGESPWLPVAGDMGL